jgi:cytochrome P450
MAATTLLEKAFDVLTAVRDAASLKFLAAIGDPVGLIESTAHTSDAGAVHDRIRRLGPLTRSRTGMYVASSHELCQQILRDPRVGVRHSDGRESLPDESRYDADNLLLDSFLSLDDPDHARLRRLAAPGFRPAVIRTYAARIEAVANRLLDRVEDAGHFDLIGDFAGPLPIEVISDLFGIPDVNRTRFAEIGNVVAQSLDGVTSYRQARELAEAHRELIGLFDVLSAERRVRPGDDVISMLVGATDAGDMTADDLHATCALLLIAGFETTVNLIGNAVSAMLAAREPWEQLVADSALADNAVEESLRLEPPVQLTSRVTHEPITLCGSLIPTDSTIVVDLAAANRDPAVFDDPSAFRVSRANAADHLAFSSGVHYCLGAGLARLEGSIALRTLSRRLPRLRTVDGGRRRHGVTLRGFASLPVSSS